MLQIRIFIASILFYEQQAKIENKFKEKEILKLEKLKALINVPFHHRFWVIFFVNVYNLHNTHS